MVDLKKWYENVILDAGRLTSMKDPELQRMYASTVVNSMDHLLHALDEKINMVEEADRRRDLTSIKNAVVRSMDHVKKDFTITGPPYVKYPWKNANSNATLAQIQETLAKSIARVNTGASVLKTNTGLSANGAISSASLDAANEAANEAATAAATAAATEAETATVAANEAATAAATTVAANEAEALATVEAENEDENENNVFSLSGNNSTPALTATGNTSKNNNAAQGGRRRLNKKRATRKNKKSRRQAKKSRRQLK